MPPATQPSPSALPIPSPQPASAQPLPQVQSQQPAPPQQAQQQQALGFISMTSTLSGGLAEPPAMKPATQTKSMAPVPPQVQAVAPKAASTTFSGLPTTTGKPKLLLGAKVWDFEFGCFQLIVLPQSA